MMKFIKKSYLLIATVTMISTSVIGCENKVENNNLDDKVVNINEQNADALNILNKSIKNISQLEKNEISTKVENISNIPISNIWIDYVELDKNKNIISNSQTFLDITLLPEEIVYISFPYKEYTETIDVISYGYESGDKDVSINLENKQIKIQGNNKLIKSSDLYEILVLSDISKKSESKDANTYSVNVKNSSKKDLGNISLKIGEKKGGMFTGVNYLPAYEVLNASQEIELNITTSLDVDKVEIIGYSYDDIMEKANINIDLKSNIAKISK